MLGQPVGTTTAEETDDIFDLVCLDFSLVYFISFRSVLERWKTVRYRTGGRGSFQRLFSGKDLTTVEKTAPSCPGEYEQQINLATMFGLFYSAPLITSYSGRETPVWRVSVTALLEWPGQDLISGLVPPLERGVQVILLGWFRLLLGAESD